MSRGSQLIDPLKQYLIQNFPAIFTDDPQTTEWIIAGIPGSSSSMWRWPRGDSRRFGGTRQRPGGIRNNANLQEWQRKTRQADIIILSLGGNDSREGNDRGYGSSRSEDNISFLLNNMARPDGALPPIYVRILRPAGTSDTDVIGDNPLFRPVIDPVEQRDLYRQRDGRNPAHLTRQGAQQYFLNERAINHIVQQIRDGLTFRPNGSYFIDPARRQTNSTETNPNSQRSAASPSSTAPAPLPPRPPPDITQNELKDNIKAFFNNSENPIMQAFEQNGAGGGLAAICKNISVDWNDSTWRTDYGSSELNARAPWWIKINMDMAVIHDITPGIGADGFMNAPVYSVGNIVNQINEIEEGDQLKKQRRIDRIIGPISNTDE